MTAQTAHKYEYDQEYHKTKMTRFCIQWHNESDADIIAKLTTVGNKSDYVRQLIRADIEKDAKGKSKE